MSAVAGAPRLPHPLALAVWLGLVTSGAEVLTRLAQAYVFRGIAHYGVAVVWMIPAANGAVFVSATLLLLLLARAIPSAGSPRTIVAALSFLGWVSLTLLLPRLHWSAEAILAAGLAVQTTRTLLPRLDALQSLVARSLPAMMGTLALAGASVALGPGVAERRAMAALPEPLAGAPNVLFLILDTVRASSLSLYGARHHTTPSLERLAARGVVFERAIAPAPYTLASHASFFTGRWLHELNVGWRNPLDRSYPTLAEVLRGAGYRTAGFSANRIYVTRNRGLARGFTHFDEYDNGLGEVARNASLTRTIVTSEPVRRLSHYDDMLGRKHAATVNAEILAWLRRPAHRPYFVFANYFDAHGPYLPPPPCDTGFGWYESSTPASERRRLRIRARHEPATLPYREARALEAAYLGAITCLDAAVGDLLEVMSRGGLLGNTIVVVASDHGEEFGEHGYFAHGNTLYLPALHVPLVIVYPGRVPAGRRVSTTVSLRDLPATLLDLVGANSKLPGRSLSPLWSETRDSAFVPSVALAEVPFDPGLPLGAPVSRGDMAAVVTDRWQYILDGAQHDEVFDLTLDPTGGRSAANTPDERARLRALLPMPGRHGKARQPGRR